MAIRPPADWDGETSSPFQPVQDTAWNKVLTLTIEDTVAKWFFQKGNCGALLAIAEAMCANGKTVSPFKDVCDIN